MSDPMHVFDRLALRRQRERAAARFARHDFLVAEIAERLADRLADVNRRFPLALDLGCHTGQLGARLGQSGGIETLVHADLARAMVRQTPAPAVVCDEEVLPFAEARFDLVMSVLSLHWVNDLPGALAQIRRSLKPDGLFLAAMLGGETLHELRQALLAAEVENEGGASPRVAPFIDLEQAGALLQRAGLALPVVDLDTITVTYQDMFALMGELRGMGETSALGARRRGASRRQTFVRAAALYHDAFAAADGRIPATFEVLYLSGWAPHESQQRALRPGSAQARLADALGAEEVPAGDQAGPRPGKKIDKEH